MATKYEFEYNYNASATFEVDEHLFTQELANEILNFFLWDYDDEGDPVDEVLKKYALEAIHCATFGNCSVYGVIEDFKNKEGFAPLNDKYGIKLLRVTAYEFLEQDLQMNKILL